MMKAEARAHGAATVINAIGLGKGASFGIGLWTDATVELNYNDKIETKIINEPEEDTTLAQNVIKTVLKRFDQTDLGAKVTIDSNIPVARGLKSSSVASNAIALATVKAVNANLEDLEIINVGVDASIASKVTITGAFDDACASYFGGLVITDNTTRRLIKRYTLPKELEVVLYVPPSKQYTIEVDVEALKEMSPLTEILWFETLKGNYWNAMTLNGYIHSVALKQSTEIALEALKLGAVAAGLSGKGPSVAAVAESAISDSIEKIWVKKGATVLRTCLNNEKAKIIE